MSEVAGQQPKNWTAVGAAAGAGVGVFAGVQALNDIPPWIQELIKTQGASLLVAAVLIALLWVMIRGGSQFIKAQTAQALAMQKVGDQLQVMTGQSGKLDEISAKLEDIKFNSGVFGDRLKRMEESLIDVKRQNDAQP